MPAMRAVRLATGQTLHPFGDAVGDVPVLNVALAQAQEAALRAAGLEPADAPLPDEPFLVYADRCWFTARLAATLAKGPPGRLRWQNPDLVRDAGAFQPDPERPELAVQPAGAPVSLDGPDLCPDIGFHGFELGKPHPAWAHAQRGAMAVGPRLAHSVVHWSDLVRANLLALSARAEDAREDWENGGLYTRLRMVGEVLWRAGWPSRARIARALAPIGKRCKIHPTAVVEACEIGDDVEIGPFAVVRASVIGDGVRIDPYVTVGLSILGPGVRVSQAGMLNLCVVYPGALVSEGGGYQMCVIGRDAFLAKTATVLDLSFGRTIKSPVARVGGEVAVADTETYFMGAAIGHRAKVGAGVRICYGASVPNDVLLVAPADTLFRRFPADAEGTLTVREGTAVRVDAGRGSTG